MAGSSCAVFCGLAGHMPLVWAELYPPQIPNSQYHWMWLFGDKACKEVVKLKWGPLGGSQPNQTGVLMRGNLNMERFQGTWGKATRSEQKRRNWGKTAMDRDSMSWTERGGSLVSQPASLVTFYFSLVFSLCSLKSSPPPAPAQSLDILWSLLTSLLSPAKSPAE